MLYILGRFVANWILISERDLSFQSVADSRCVFWDHTISTWSDVGCQTIKSTEKTECHCDHLTNFALIMVGDLMLSDDKLIQLV